MKKLIIVSLVLAGAATMYAQGTVKFATTGGRASYATVADGSATAVGSFLGADMIGAVMYDGKEIGRANFVEKSGIPSGRLGGDTLAVEGLAAGGTFTFILEAFNAAYEAVADKSTLYAGGPDGLYFGVSAPFSYTTGNPSDPLALPAAAMNVANFGVDAYSVIPEPTTIALGILGLSSLLLFRRRD